MADDGRAEGRPPCRCNHVDSFPPRPRPSACLGRGSSRGCHPCPYFGRSRVLEMTESGIREGFATLLGAWSRPLLANNVLHYGLDEWFAKEVRPRLKGEAFLIRYADDFVIGVAREDDARRIMEVLPKRMSKYGLTVHPEKTRVVRFYPADVADSEPADQNSTGPRTFDFLGFTHYWGRSLRGGWVVKS